jgi:hypothetical protein
VMLTIAVLIVLFGTVNIALKVHELKQLSWMRLTWTPYLNDIENHINPTHKTLPGDM